jgi:hypothetical protein
MYFKIISSFSKSVSQKASKLVVLEQTFGTGRNFEALEKQGFALPNIIFIVIFESGEAKHRFQSVKIFLPFPKARPKYPKKNHQKK